MTLRFLDLQAATQELREELDAAWARVRDSGRYVLGAEVADFERAFAAACQTRYAIGVGNGLDALALALEAAGVRAGDEVVVPAHTFIATWLAVTQLGAVPRAAEPEEGRYNVSARTLEAALTPRTRAVVVVHLYGEPVEMEPVESLVRLRGLVLIEDAAQAHGARCGGRPVGSFGEAAAFSFYPGKNLGAMGDGGALTCSDERVWQRALRLRNYGAVRKYEHELRGRNSRLDALQAAVLRVKLAHLDGWNERRRRTAALYRRELADLGGLELPATLPGNDPVWHLFVVGTARRDALAAHLAADGIETLVHYPVPVYRSPAFAEYGPAHATRSDDLSREVLSLPIGPHLGEADAGRVVASVRRFFRGEPAGRDRMT